jgi:hypothetical protein
MRHLPSVEALSDVDDKRMLAELEIRHMLDKLARATALVERARGLLMSALSGEARGGRLEVVSLDADCELSK